MFLIFVQFPAIHVTNLHLFIFQIFPFDSKLSVKKKQKNYLKPKYVKNDYLFTFQIFSLIEKLPKIQIPKNRYLFIFQIFHLDIFYKMIIKHN